MLRPEIISGPALKEVLQSAADAQAPATVAVPLQNQWIAFRGRLAPMERGLLPVRFPGQQPAHPREAMAGKTLQIIIKHRDYRYLGNVALGPGPATGPLSDCLIASPPAQMTRFERRLHRRVDVPSKFDVRVQIRIGDESSPAWTGRAVNLSIGGVQARVSGSLLTFFEPGDIAFVTVTFGADNESFIVYAHFRGGTRDGDMALAGFEFGETGGLEDHHRTVEIITRHLRAFEEAGA